MKLIRKDKLTSVDVTTYRDGAEGMILWCEDKVCAPIYPEGSPVPIWFPMGELPDTVNPETGRSYKSMWEEQKKVLREALRMENGRFVYNLLVLCWPRGEGKSFIVCLIQLWRFYNWPEQKIMLGANSKDQIKFVHYDIMRDIILNSPKLLAEVGGDRNIQEKEIRMKDSRGKVRSIIRSISTMTGIVSNITGYTFSEMFDMKKPRFFTQLHGSIRNVPNAIGTIDSTVSDKLHVLYTIYQNFQRRKAKRTFFSYRSSPKGDYRDYWHPNMTQVQLNDYETTFPFGEYEKYFKNLWSAGSENVFTEEMIEETRTIGTKTQLIAHSEVQRLLSIKWKALRAEQFAKDKGFSESVQEHKEKVYEAEIQLRRVSEVYTLKDRFGAPTMASVSDLVKMGNMFDTDWSILVGADFGDPYAVRGLARTILVAVAKGLPGSRSNPLAYIGESISPKYLYVVLLVSNVKDHSVNSVKDLLDDIHTEFQGIDVFCSERWGTGDIEKFCEERDIKFEAIFPTYDRQKDAFKEFLSSVKDGRYKCPELGIAGTKQEDIREEEMSIFNHDSDKKWFGSPEKGEKFGVQDDWMFANAWALFGGRLLGVEDFRSRTGTAFFGWHQESGSLVGDYR